jgi:hypothetical protein
MKIIVNIPRGTKILIEGGAHPSALLQALTASKLVECEYSGDSQKWSMCAPEKAISFEIKPDDFITNVSGHDQFKLLEAKKDEARQRWIESYQKYRALDRQLEELHANLIERGVDYKKETPAA